MFLSLLNLQQKKLFMSFAYILADSDGDYSDYEKVAIKGYLKEMDIEMPKDQADTNLEYVVDTLNEISSMREKRIIIFEIIGLAMADYNYDDGERKIVKNAMNVFGIDYNYGDYCEKKIAEYLELQTELSNKVLSY